MIGICVELCGLHGYCPNGELCCSNGCGHVCTTPITGIYVKWNIPLYVHAKPCTIMCSYFILLCLVKPGDCPDPRFTRQCGTRCRHDGNCPGEMKCCQTSCGQVCRRPFWSSTQQLCHIGWAAWLKTKKCIKNNCYYFGIWTILCFLMCNNCGKIFKAIFSHVLFCTVSEFCSFWRDENSEKICDEF